MSSPDGYYVAGNILTQIGIGMQTITVTNTVGMTSSSTVQITHTQNITATGDTLITEFATMNSSGTSNIIVYNDNKTAISTITLNSTSTLDDLFNALAANGIQAGISNGVISMSSPDGYYVAGRRRKHSYTNRYRDANYYCNQHRWYDSFLNCTSYAYTKYYCYRGYSDNRIRYHERFRYFQHHRLQR